MTSGAFRDKLRRLRREGAPQEGSEGASEERRGRMPTWLRERLAARPGATDEDPGAALESLRADDLAPGAPAGLETCAGPEGEVCARNTAYAADDVHGDWRLDEVHHADGEAIALLAGDPGLAQVDLTRAVYLDTETTGLSGGAGTYVFMIGLGAFDRAGRFSVWQGFLPGPDGERALLAEVARRIAGASAVVSFFGKSFDRHRLEDKMRIAGVEPPFDGLPHLDLYHPFQRLTKGRLRDGRLATMESELCGLEREDDLPGALAPAAWFDYLGDRVHRLEGVFRHNLLDVVSLVTLAAYLGRTEHETRADGRELPGCAFGRARGLGRSLLAAGKRERAQPWLERALERGAPLGEDLRPLILAQAENLRRLKRTEEARAAYERLAANDPRDTLWSKSVDGLVKLLEHDLHDHTAARELCASTLERAADLRPVSERRRLVADLEKRLTRLGPA